MPQKIPGCRSSFHDGGVTCIIDAFTDDWIETLATRSAELAPQTHLYVLLDGAFVPGLHKMLSADRKALMFASLPGCTENTEAVSPFLFPFLPADKGLRSLLRRCDRWPMVSVIETPETLQGLADRLSAWCVVEADGQRFNFRFADTRRLPAIFSTLKPEQRARIAGPAACWSFIGRSGRWLDLDVIPSDESVAIAPELDALQFAALVTDSLADELIVLLGDRGHDLFRTPSTAHALVNTALRAASKVKLHEQHRLDWCEWFWLHGQSLDDSGAASALATWRNTVE